MKKFFLISILAFLSSCVFIDDSGKLKKEINNSNDLMTLTFNEYKIYIEEYSKKSKYPDINE